ncbi:right-handed parallel beta-helix repeat-containing protein [Actinoplanes subtropicus]|uniref:right-handed parallel beta-helix repeat-containing protein n=1 Tax=Actinoplanes subtropicus TaxID=543632 RepID=UPI0004C2D253|nr:right-handed parallel beta-helix repeat-containing protein [Actinoplanes subtropicus]
MLGLQHAAPPAHPRFTSGSAWLASRAVGEVTLVDGVSAAAVASVRVGAANAPFTEVQAAADGYVVGSGGSELVGVNAATLAKKTFRLPPAARDTVLFPLAAGLLAADAGTKTVRMFDATTIQAVGRAIGLPGPNFVFAGVGSSLWAADPDSGAVLAIDATANGPVKRVSRRMPGTAGHDIALTSTGDEAVLLNPGDHAVTWLSRSDGRVTATMATPLRAGDLATGVGWRSSVLIVQHDSGTLYACERHRSGCDRGIPVAPAGSQLGVPVAIDHYAFVPDYGADAVWITDLATGQVTRSQPLFGQPIRFELLARAGLVFVNDPESENAAMVAADGSVRRLIKYEPPPAPAVSHTPSARPSRSASPTPVPSRSPTPSGKGSGTVGSSPGTGPGTAASSPGTGSGGVPSSSPTVLPPGRIDAIRVQPVTPEAGQPATISAEVSGTRPDTWAWTVTDESGRQEAADAPETFTHTFAAPGRYAVKLTIGGPAGTDSQAETVTVIPASPPVHCGDVIKVSVVLHQDLDCTGSGLTIGAPDIVFDLDTHTITGGFLTATDHADITVRNGTVGAAITFTRSPFSTFSDLYVRNAEFEVRSSDNVQILHSRLENVTYKAGASVDMLLSGVTVTNGRFIFGQPQGGTPGLVVSDCHFTDSVVGFSTATNISVNRVSFLRSGISLIESGPMTFRDNTVVASPLNLDVQSGGATISHNQFRDADSAIVLGVRSTSATIDDNTFTNNGIGIGLAERADTPIDGLNIVNNVFESNRAAGIYLDATAIVPGGPMMLIGGNHLIGNGRRSNGRTDSLGRPVNDGVHLVVPANSGLVLRNNETRDNADYGIEAGTGTVTDGGGNTSRNNPSGCSGVRCG